MRKNVGIVMLGLSGFLLLVATVCLVWVPGQIERTPLDADTVTRLSGTAAKLDTSTGELVDYDVAATSTNQVDSEASDDDVVVFVNTSCLVVDDGEVPSCVDSDDPRLLSASTDVFATDRVTAEAVDGEGYLPPGSVPHEGVVNKFPFDAEKTTYAYWDTVVQRAVDAVYDRTEEVAGVEAYVYRVTLTDEPIEVAEGVPGTYDDLKEIYVEPRTGSIIHQTDDQQRYLEDGTQALDLQLAFTEEQQATSAGEAEDSAAMLDLMTRTVPIAGLVGGVLLLLGGLFLVLTGARSGRPEREEQPVPVG